LHIVRFISWSWQGSWENVVPLAAFVLIETSGIEKVDLGTTEASAAVAEQIVAAVVVKQFVVVVGQIVAVVFAEQIAVVVEQIVAVVEQIVAVLGQIAAVWQIVALVG